MVDNKDLYEKALLLKGEISQLDITIEECSELVQAIIKYKRNEGLYEREVLKEKIAEELCDVKVMIEQMLVTLDVEEEFNKMYDKKINRLRKRLELTEQGKQLEE